MDILLLILAMFMLVVGLLGCVLPGLPGPPLSYLGLLLMHWSDYAEFSVYSLIAWGVAMVVISVIDLLLTPWMTKRFGGSKGANWGSMIGLVVGIFLPIPLGALLGPFVGAYIGEVVYVRKATGRAFKAAFGAFLSFFVGTGIKLVLSIGMIIAVVRAIWESF